MSLQEIENKIREFNELPEIKLFNIQNEIIFNEQPIFEHLEFNDNDKGKRRTIYNENGLKLEELYTRTEYPQLLHAFLLCVSPLYQTVFSKVPPTDKGDLNSENEFVTEEKLRYIRRREYLVKLGIFLISFFENKLRENRINISLNNPLLFEALSKIFKINIIILDNDNSFYINESSTKFICIRAYSFISEIRYNSILINENSIIDNSLAEQVYNIKITIEPINYTILPDRPLLSLDELNLICTEFKGLPEDKFNFFRIAQIEKPEIMVYGFDDNNILVFLEKKNKQFFNKYITFYENNPEHKKKLQKLIDYLS